MKLLHTSDWHLGRMLYGKRRYDEFQAFLDWMAKSVEEEAPDLVIIAGDVFDTTTPSNRAQELYFEFLDRVAGSACGHIVVIGGNHDSPSFLDAPKRFLKRLGVHVVGQALSPDEEVLVLDRSDGTPLAVVAAAPYLRDRDIRTSEAGETAEDKEGKLLEGIRFHYAELAAEAERRRPAPDVPIIGTGHLFAAGGSTVEGDGVRDLYVGSLAHVEAAIFPELFDYVALGHLHVPQKVGGRETVRYSGSPIAMGFGEVAQQKSLCRVVIEDGRADVSLIDIPKFHVMKRLSGDWPSIEEGLLKLTAEDAPAWVEVVYGGADVIGDLRDRLAALVEGSAVEILRVKDDRLIERALASAEETPEMLEELAPEDVFHRRLALEEVTTEQADALTTRFQEAVASLEAGDEN